MKTLTLILGLFLSINAFAAQFNPIGTCGIDDLTGVEDINIKIYAAKKGKKAFLTVAYSIEDESHSFAVDGTVRYDDDGYPLVSSKELKVKNIHISDEDPTYTSVYVGTYRFNVRCYYSRK